LSDRAVRPIREVIAIASMLTLGGLALVAYRVLERERMRMEARQLRLASELGVARKMDAIARLAAAVAHDFGNLLQVIRGRSDMIADQIDRGDPLQEDIREIQSATTRATDLASELKMLGRTLPTSLTTASLNDALTRAGRLLTPLFDERTALQFKLNATADAVRVDPLQLDRVVLNLGTNARDAMPNGGVLIFETLNPPLGEFEGQPYVDVTRILLHVTDTGVGMAPETIDQIFEPFYTTKETGSGLGLSIVHGLVQQFGGAISVESRPRHGTTFTIALPVVRVTTLPASESTGDPVPSAAVLVVDTDAVNRQLLRRLLADLNRPILTAASAQEAAQVAAHYGGAIAVAVIDISSDGGQTIVDTVRASHPEMKALLLAQDQPIQVDVLDTVLREPFELTDVLNATKALLR
jgi:signal transduction histidine kinase